MTRLLDSRLPIVAAPMAGGPTSVALAQAAGRAGAFPFLAAGYKSPQVMADEIGQLRRSGTAFGVNLFVPDRNGADPVALASYAASLKPEADAYGVTLDPVPVSDDDHWRDKLDLLLQQPVPVVSFTFGLPARAEVAELQEAGSRVLAGVTTVEEAVAAADLRVDGLVVQGPRAGGHSATHDPARVPDLVETDALVRQVREHVQLPIIAGGGVDGPAAVRRILAAGAEAVVVGTLLLRTDEAGTSAPHRAALADPAFDQTVITRAFTGRPARALRNEFSDRHTAGAPVAYPAVHHLTRALRQAAAAAGDAQHLHLWAGTGYRAARPGPVADVIHSLTE